MEEIKNIPQKGKLKRVVIIGGGFAGLKLARLLNKRLFQVILIDKLNYHQFQPLLYQVATSGLEPSSIAFPFRKVFQKTVAFHFRLCSATRVIPGEHILETDIGSIEYDYLVIATGGDTNFFGNNMLKENAMTLKSIPEALYMRNHILQSFERALTTQNDDEVDELLNFVIVGGGPTGVELAGALAEMRKYVLPKDYPELDNMKMKVTIIDATSKLLGTMSEKSSLNALKFMKRLAVNVITGCTVKGYDGKVVELGNGDKIRSANVFWVAGITANNLNGIAPEMLTRGARIEVDSFNKVKLYDSVYAIGDTSLMTEEEYPKGHPQVAQAAIQQARLLAENLEKGLKGKTLKPFHYKDKGSMATVGRNLAVADIYFLHIGGLPAWMIWLFVHLMAIVGAKNRLFIFLNWMWNYFTFDQSLRLLISTRQDDNQK
jgi:NADH:ubiquinone reductase (H+-translocating)